MSESDQNIQLISNNSIDRVWWDSLVDRSAGPNIYCYSWYLDAVSENWDALVDKQNDLAFPIPWVSKKGVDIIYQPFFSRELNLIGGGEFNSAWYSKLPSTFKLVDFSIGVGLDKIEAEVNEVVHQELILNTDYDTLRTGFSKNVKRILNKPEGIEVKQEGEVKELIQLFEKTVGESLNFTTDNLTRLERLMNVGIQRGVGKVYSSYVNGALAATGYFFIQNNRVTYLKGATTELGKSRGAMHFIFNELIKLHSSSEMVLDFGGSKIESIASFYKRFGAVDRPYYMYSKNSLPWVLKKAKGLRDKLKK